MRLFSKSRFKDDTKGLISFEFLILIPVFLFMIFTTYSLYNLFHKRTMSVRATAVVQDLFGRQSFVDDAFMERMHGMFRTIAQARSTGSASQVEGTWMRVSVIQNQAANADEGDQTTVVWSDVRGSQGLMLPAPLGTGSGSYVNDAVPSLAPGESIVLVETSREATKIFSTSNLNGILGDVTFENRFAFKLRFTGNRLVHLDKPQPDDPPLEGSPNT